MGFDGLFFGRADYEDYQTRNRTKTMEMVWKASANLGKWMRALFPFEHYSGDRHLFTGEQSWLFTGILPHGYGAPDSFCFDYRCSDNPIMVSVWTQFYASCLILSIIQNDLIFENDCLHALTRSRMIIVVSISMYKNVFEVSFKLHMMRFVSNINPSRDF